MIWGVNCRNVIGRGDIPSGEVRIEQSNRFKSWLEGAVSGLTVPAHSSVRHLALSDDDGLTGFVVSLIPSSELAPHQTVPDTRYLMRSGSNFAPVPHGVLAGMFGRRPQPRLIHKYAVALATQLPSKIVQVNFGIFVRNLGPAIAEDLYLNLMIRKYGGDKSSVEITPPDPTLWDGQHSFGVFMSVIAKPHFRLAPEAHLQPLSLTWKLQPPFTEPFQLEGSYGTTGTNLYKFSRSVQPDQLYNAWELVAMTPNGNAATFRLATDQCTEILFGSPKE